MRHFNKFNLIILFTTISVNSFSQSLENFNDVLSEKKIGKAVIKKVGKDISERTYLGVITDDRGQSKYYVVKEFLRIQAAIVFHGHSRILFFNMQNKLIKEAILSSNDELPFKFKANSLYFRYSENGIKKIFIEDVSTFPKMIWVKPDDCFDVSNP